jgi:hypothetical protein
VLCKHEVVGSIPSGSTIFGVCRPCREEYGFRRSAGGDVDIVKKGYAELGCTSGDTPTGLSRLARERGPSRYISMKTGLSKRLAVSAAEVDVL